MEWSWFTILGILLIYALLNLVALFTFYLDKRKAARGRWRFRERSLLTVAFIGPFGAYMGMKLFRHKTRKSLFILVPFFVILHAILIAYLLTVV